MFTNFKRIPYINAVNRSLHPAILGYEDPDLEYLSQLAAFNRPTDLEGAKNVSSRMAVLHGPNIWDNPIKTSVYGLSHGRGPGQGYHPDRGTEPLLYQKLMNEYPEFWGDLGDPFHDRLDLSSSENSRAVLEPFRERYKGLGYITKLFSERGPCANREGQGCKDFLQYTLNNQRNVNPLLNDVVYSSVPADAFNAQLQRAHREAIHSLDSPKKISDSILREMPVIDEWAPRLNTFRENYDIQQFPNPFSIRSNPLSFSHPGQDVNFVPIAAAHRSGASRFVGHNAIPMADIYRPSMTPQEILSNARREGRARDRREREAEAEGMDAVDMKEEELYNEIERASQTQAAEAAAEAFFNQNEGAPAPQYEEIDSHGGRVGRKFGGSIRPKRRKVKAIDAFMNYLNYLNSKQYL